MRAWYGEIVVWIYNGRAVGVYCAMRNVLNGILMVYIVHSVRNDVISMIGTCVAPHKVLD